MRNSQGETPKLQLLLMGRSPNNKKQGGCNERRKCECYKTHLKKKGNITPKIINLSALWKPKTFPSQSKKALHFSGLSILPIYTINTLNTLNHLAAGGSKTTTLVHYYTFSMQHTMGSETFKT